MKTLVSLALILLLSGLNCAAEALTEKEVVTLFQSGFTATEVLEEVRKQGYAGARDAATMKRLREAGANAEIILSLSQAGRPPAPASTAVVGEDWEPFVDEIGKYGFKNETGKIVIPPKWDGAGLFQVAEQRAYVQLGEKYGFIDASGKLVIPAQWDMADDFREGLASVKKDDLWGYIDPTGKLVIPLKWGVVGSFFEGLAEVSRLEFDKSGGLCYEGMIDKSGKVVIPEKWHLLEKKVGEDEIYCRNYTTQGVLLQTLLMQVPSKSIDQLLKDPETGAGLEEVKEVKESDWDEAIKNMLSVFLYLGDTDESKLEETARVAKKHGIDLFRERANYRITGPGRVELKK